jgi:2-methylcitrate synthase
MAEVSFAKGLEGVIASETEICKIDGVNGRLYYLGYSIEDLIEHSDFEEVSYLLLYGELPKAQELEVFRRKMRDSREVSPAIIEMVRSFPKESHPMELLQSAIAYISGYVQHKIHHSATCNCRNTLHQIAQITTVVAAWTRFQRGLEYVPPRTDLSHGANFLYMIRGEVPEPDEGEIMDKTLILHAEHGFNASTFTARVVASTISTCYSSISAAIGSLYGSLHGGANEKVLEMIDEIGSPEKVSAWMDKAVAEKRKVMGMGHRVYKAMDPRATIMEQYLIQLSDKKNDHNDYEILKEVQKEFRARMEEKGKPLYPNVDFFSGSVYKLLGLPTKIFTPIFAMARASGWLAHILEQRKDNRLYRPKGLYTGSDGRDFVPIGRR